MTAVHIAAKSANFSICETLIKAKADLNTVNNKVRTKENIKKSKKKITKRQKREKQFYIY